MGRSTFVGASVRRVISFVVSLALSFSAIPMLHGTAIAAAEPLAGSVAQQAAPVEVISRRTEDSKTFQMPDGSFKATISSGPIHFKDRTGRWADIVDSLVRDSATGEYRNTAGALSIRLRPRMTADQSLTAVAGEGWTANLSMRSTRPAVAGAVTSNAITYSAVATATDLNYQVVGGGLKETLVLKSAAAPTTFSFNLLLQGAELKKAADGTWGIFKPGESEPEAVLGELSVVDSSGGAKGMPACCADATMAVRPIPGGESVTYSLPRTWLADPARVFPVKIDPTLKPYSSAFGDTFVRERYPTEAHGSDALTWIGCEVTGRSDCDRRAYVKFDLSPAGSGIPHGATILSSNLGVYLYSNNGAGYSLPTYLWLLNSYWHEGYTWANRPQFTTCLGSQYISAPSGWINWNVASTVQSWVNSGGNYGFMLDQMEDGTQNQTKYSKCFYTREDAWDVRPTLTVIYTTSVPIARATCSASSGTAPLSVNFDSSGSSDDVGIVSRAWDFDGDGTIESTAVAPTFTYSQPASSVWRLTVTDGEGQSSSTTGSVKAFVSAAASDARNARPILVFVVGGGQSQPEYPPDTYAGLPPLGKSPSQAKDSGRFNAIVASLQAAYWIVKVPAQPKEVRNPLKTTRKAVLWDHGPVYLNGTALLEYLRLNKRVSSGSGRSRRVKKYILVTHSKGGLDSRAFLDRACGSTAENRRFRAQCLGVVQLGTPNYGAQAAVDYRLALIATYKAKHPTANATARVNSLYRDLLDLAPSRWTGSNNNYNRKLRNASRKPYWRIAGNAVWRFGTKTNCDAVVSCTTVRGPSFLETAPPGYRKAEYQELAYGVHGHESIPLNPLPYFLAHPTSMLCEKRYNSSDASETANWRHYKDVYSWTVRQIAKPPARSATFPDGSPVQGSPPLESSPADAGVDAGVAAGAASEGGMVAIKEAGNDARPESLRVTAASPLVVDGLSTEGSVTVQDDFGQPVSVETTLVPPDETQDTTTSTMVVAVEATGTYTLKIADATDSVACVSEVEGPTVDVRAPDLVAGIADVATVSVVGASDGLPTTETGWSYQAWADETTVPANDSGVWPDETAGDGVASVLLPAEAAGVHELTVQATKAEGEDEGRIRFTSVPLVAVQTGTVSLPNGVTVGRTLDELGLVESFDVRVPVSNNSDVTQTVDVECQVDGTPGVQQLASAEATLSPGSLQTVSVPFSGSDLAAAACDQTFRVSRVGVAYRCVDDDPSEEESVAADSLGPAGEGAVLAESFPTGVQFQLVKDQVSLRECKVTATSVPYSAPGMVRVEGTAIWHGSSIDGVEYSLDGGVAWYKATASDGAWGSTVENFTVVFEMPQDGSYVMQVRPITQSARWDFGDEVPICVGDEYQ
jgi:PKD repeat protein